MQDNKNLEYSTNILPHSNILWYSSIIFFIIILLLTIGLFVSTKKIQNTVVLIEKEIEQIDNNMRNVNIDPNIIIAKIIQENRIMPTIDLKNIITQFNRAAIKANVIFEGFTIRDNTINTTLISTVGNTVHSDPVATIISMMNDY